MSFLFASVWVTDGKDSCRDAAGDSAQSQHNLTLVFLTIGIRLSQLENAIQATVAVAVKYNKKQVRNSTHILRILTPAFVFLPFSFV